MFRLCQWLRGGCPGAKEARTDAGSEDTQDENPGHGRGGGGGLEDKPDGQAVGQRTGRAQARGQIRWSDQLSITLSDGLGAQCSQCLKCVTAL